MNYEPILSSLKRKMTRQTEALAETAAHIAAIQNLQTQQNALRNKEEPELPLPGSDDKKKK